MKNNHLSNRDLITNEIPIKDPDDDFFNFTEFAEKIKKIIQGYADNTEPLTIGIYGKWGDGKTSLLNLIEKNIERFEKKKNDLPIIKFHYSPWLYHSEKEMIEDFFENLSKKTFSNSNPELKKAGKLIKKYSRYLKAIKISANIGIPNKFGGGMSFEPSEILKALGEDLSGDNKTLLEIKKEINKVLEKSNYKIIIFIDDIDRLDKKEIYSVFKLIKNVVNFNNLVFILAFDPDYVAKAIFNRYGNDEIAGKKFLEKIINIPLELPLIENADLDYFVKTKLEEKLEKLNVDEIQKIDLIQKINGRYFENPREFIRILNAFTISAHIVGNEVNIHDLFWIEYLKIKNPIVYKLIKDYVKFITNRMLINEIITFEHDDTLEKIKEKSKNLTFTVVKSLFNGKDKNQIDKELRVCSLNHIEKYFSYHTKRKVSEVKFMV